VDGLVVQAEASTYQADTLAGKSAMRYTNYCAESKLSTLLGDTETTGQAALWLIGPPRWPS
jgi:hypothetical protein